MSIREEHTRKHEILDAAERLMLRQGYAATSMGAICADVGGHEGRTVSPLCVQKEDLAPGRPRPLDRQGHWPRSHSHWIPDRMMIH